jgi:ribosomal protein L37AE/L43A
MSKTRKPARPPGVNPHARSCTATSKKTGKPCANPAVAGSDFCRMHGGKGDGGTENSSETARNKAPAVGKHGPGARPGNKNAVTHGAYALTLLPEEQAIYEQKRQQFTAELGNVDAFDLQLSHMLALIASKLDVAAAKGAPAEALIPLSGEIVRLLRSLKATRDSKDPEAENAIKTAADFLNELIERDRERGVTVSEDTLQTRVYELEHEVNDLRARLNMEPRPDIAHRMDTCSHCRRETQQRLTADGLWVCLRCGWAMEERGVETETPPAEKETTISPTPETQAHGG